MRTGLLTVALATVLAVAASAPAGANGPYGPRRHGGWGRYHGYYYTTPLPSFRTIRVERSTTINRTSRPERKQMAVAFIRKNGYLSVSKYCRFTGLDSEFAEAELDSFTLDKTYPLARTTQGKKTVYVLADE